MTWHRCQRWWAQDFDCVYHREVPEESQEEDEDDEEDSDPDEKFPWPVPLLENKKPPPRRGKARASVSEIVARTVPLVVAVGAPEPEPVKVPGGGGAPVLVPPPAVVFEPFMQPALIPEGGPNALVPGGLPPVETGRLPGGSGFNVFNNPDPATGVSASDVGRALGIAIAAAVVTVIVARFPYVAGPVARYAGKVPPLPLFPLFAGIAKYATRAEDDLALAERAVIDSINKSLDLSMLYQADFRERQLQADQTETRDADPIPQANSPPLLFNAIERMAGFQLPPESEFDWRSVGLQRPP